MKRNFEIQKGVEIHLDGTWCDLHNQYDFIGCAHFASRCLSLVFRPNAEFGQGCPWVSFNFEGVTFFRSVLEGKVELQRLLELGFKEPDDVDYDWSDGYGKSSKDAHLVFFLEGEQQSYYRVYAEQVRAVLFERAEAGVFTNLN